MVALGEVAIDDADHPRSASGLSISTSYRVRAIRWTPYRRRRRFGAANAGGTRGPVGSWSARHALTPCTESRYHLPSRPSAFVAPCSPATRSLAPPINHQHAPTTEREAHVRSHRDRREAVPRRGRHRTRGGAAGRRAGRFASRSIASSSSPTARTPRSAVRSWPVPSSDAEVVRQDRGQKLDRLQVPPEGTHPRHEGSPRGADHPADHRHHVRLARAPPQRRARLGGKTRRPAKRPRRPRRPRPPRTQPLPPSCAARRRRRPPRPRG